MDERKLIGAQRACQNNNFPSLKYDFKKNEKIELKRLWKGNINFKLSARNGNVFEPLIVSSPPRCRDKGRRRPCVCVDLTHGLIQTKKNALKQQN